MFLAFGYVWGVATAFTGILTNLFAFNGGVLPPLAYLLYPPFAYMRGIFVITHVRLIPINYGLSLPGDRGAYPCINGTSRDHGVVLRALHARLQRYFCRIIPLF